MDINLGPFNLTKKQFEQSNILKSEVIRGFSYRSRSKELTVVSVRELSDQEISSLKESISNLPDENTEEENDRIAQGKLSAVIEAKKTELAVVELKREGKLDASGKLVTLPVV